MITLNPQDARNIKLISGSSIPATSTVQQASRNKTKYTRIKQNKQHSSKQARSLACNKGKRKREGERKREKERRKP
jgi:hypothetical protein